MLRKKGVISLLILIALFFVLGYFFTNTWLEGKLEKTGSAIAGAKVEIDDLNISLFTLNLKWQRLQVTDAQQTMKNLFETGPCQLDFEFWPMLSKKIIVEDFTISGVRTNTDREEDGALSESEIAEIESSIIHKGATRISDSAKNTFSGLTRKANVDSVLKIAGLTAPGKIDSLYKSYENNYQKWDKRLKESNPLPKIKQIEQQITGIDVSNLKDVKKLTKALEQAASAKKSVDKLNKEVKTLNKDFKNDYKAAQSGLTKMDDWLNADYQRAADLLQIPEFSATNIGKMIFGQALTGRLNSYLGYLQTARAYQAKYIPASPKEEKPPRLRGQDIYFPNPNARPDFWIKNLHLSGVTADSIRLEGTATHIVSQPKIIGQVTSFELKGRNAVSASLEFNGILDYLDEVPREQFNLAYYGFSLAGKRLSDSPFLPNKVQKGFGNLQASLDIQGNNLKSNINFSAQKLKFDSGKPGNSEFEKIVRDIVQNTDKVDFKAKVIGPFDKLTYSLNSNLDDIFMRNLKARFGKELDKARNKIEQHIAKETKNQKEKLNKLIRENETKLKKQLAEYEQAIDKQMQKIEAKKKEIEKKLEKEKKKLGKDAVKKLKGLF